MKVFDNVSYGGNERNVLDLYIPEKDTATVFIYIHGGGFEEGSQKDKDVVNMATALAKKGIAVVCPTYRLYPDAKYPEFIEDGACAVKWVFENMDKYITAEKIFVGGQSAGAYITQNLCFNDKYLRKHGITNEMIAGYFHDAGQPTTHFNVLNERGIDSGRVIIDDAAPLYYIDGKGYYPPMEFVVAANDIPNRYEQTKLLMSTLKNFGHEDIKLHVMENCTHVSYNDIMDKNGNPCLTETVYNFLMR